MDRQNPQNTDSLEVRDLAVASTLFSSEGITLVGKKKLPNGTVVFLFSPRTLAEEIVSQYWSLNARPIQPKRLFSAQRDLKDLLYKS